MTKAHTCLLATAAVGVAALLLHHGRTEARPAPAKPQAAPTQVAVCDVVHVFGHAEKAQEWTAALNDRRKEVQAEDKKKLKAIREIESMLPELRGAAYDGQLAKARQMTLARQAWIEMEEAKSRRDWYVHSAALYGDIMRTVAAVANERGVDVVLYHRRRPDDLAAPPKLLQTLLAGGDARKMLLPQIENRKVIYSTPEVDLTEEVLVRVNRARPGGKKGS